jgi:hypothetical protein
MKSIRIDFNPPRDRGFEELKIWQSTTATGPWQLIETVTEIGAYPDYISDYTTDQAGDNAAYLAVEWVDDKGASTDLSNPLQVGTEKLVGEIVNRVMQRDSTLDENVIFQETEAVVEDYFDVDPYSLDVSYANYKTITGLTYLVLARSLITTQITQAAAANFDSVTLGLVSIKSGSTSSQQQTNLRNYLDQLLELANTNLGINTSVILQMEAIQVGGRKAIEWDQSRLMLWTDLT